MEYIYETKGTCSKKIIIELERDITSCPDQLAKALEQIKKE